MSDRSPHTVRLDDDTWDKFVSWVEEVEGQKHGEIGRHVENALSEYLNEDRLARLEKNQHEIQEQLHELQDLLAHSGSTHTHKENPGCNSGTRVEAIHREIVNMDKGAVKNETVERVIEDVAGLDVGDPRTIRRYKEKLRRRGLLFEHPGEPPLWTADRDLWGNWATGAATCRNELESSVEPYPAQVYENGHGLQIEIQEADI